MTFTHLLLTGFNVRMKHQPGLDPTWLTHRFELFERFCFPSVRAQTNPDFKWIVLLDADTPDPFKRRIDACARWDRFRPYYSSVFDDYQGAVRENLEPGTTHLITTTLDNDDAIADTFVEAVQRQFRGQDFELVNFPFGYRLKLHTGKLYEHRVAANPFISLFERRTEGDPTTIRGCGPHNLLQAKYPTIRDVESEPLWLQVVHDRNIAATGIWGCRRVPASRLAQRFTVDWKPRKQRELAASIALENVWRRLERALIRSSSPRTIAAARRMIKALRSR